jgi:hypothetical protein
MERQGMKKVTEREQKQNGKTTKRNVPPRCILGTTHCKKRVAVKTINTKKIPVRRLEQKNVKTEPKQKNEKGLLQARKRFECTIQISS